MRFAQSLREPHEGAWGSLLSNPFVAEMADASLPAEKFRFYIEQNLQYLPEYAKVLGLGASRSTTAAQLNRFTKSLYQIVEIEIGTNNRLRQSIIAQGAEDRGGAIESSPTCLAYSSFLIATGATGNALDIMTAILPCAWSYYEIARQYPDPSPHPVYSEWLGFFSSDDYAEYITGLLDEFDNFVCDIAEHDLARLRGLFLTGMRFERAFWDMAYTTQRWPDSEGPAHYDRTPDSGS